MNVHRVKPCAQNRLKLVRFLYLPLVMSFFPLPTTPTWFSTPDSTDGIRDAGGEAEAPGAGDSRVRLFPTLQPRRGFHHLPSNLHFRYSSLRRRCMYAQEMNAKTTGTCLSTGSTCLPESRRKDMHKVCGVSRGKPLPCWPSMAL